VLVSGGGGEGVSDGREAQAAAAAMSASKI